MTKPFILKKKIIFVCIPKTTRMQQGTIFFAVLFKNHRLTYFGPLKRKTISCILLP